MGKKLIRLLTIPAIIFGLTVSNYGKEIKINNSLYDVSANKIVQIKSSFLDDGKIEMGAVSDIEGAIKNASESAKKLKGRNADLIIIAGDCYENKKIRRNPIFSDSDNDLEQMVEGIKPYAKLGIPIFVIPGNHEELDIYNKAIIKLYNSYSNIFDINHKSVDLKGLNIVGLGGYYDSHFLPANGFLLNSEDYKIANKELDSFNLQKEPLFLITHSPPKSTTRIDWVAGFGNVGDEKLAEILNDKKSNFIINLCGHIHEGGGNSARYKNGITINVASITPYNTPRNANTSLLTISNENVSYEELK